MISLAILALTAVSGAALESECSSVPVCDTDKPTFVRETPGCGIDELARHAGLHWLQTGDEIELKALGEASSVPGTDGRLCVAGSELSSGGKLLRVDILLQLRESRQRRLARWFRVRREGFYWQSLGAIEAAKNLEPGSFQLRYGEVDIFPRVTAIEWPENLRSARKIGAGAVVTPDDVEQIPFVKVGDFLELKVASGPIQLALKATSLSDVASGGVARLALEHNGVHTYGILLDQETAIPCRLPLRDRIDDCKR